MRTAYQRQIQRIEDRRALLSSTRVSWQADQASLIEWQSSHEDSVRKIMQERESSTLWRSNVTRDVQVLTATRDMIISTQAASHSALSSSSESTISSHSPEMLLFLAAREQLDAVQESLSALLISQVGTMTPTRTPHLRPHPRPHPHPHPRPPFLLIPIHSLIVFPYPPSSFFSLVLSYPILSDIYLINFACQ